MKRSGRASLLTLLAVGSVLLVMALLFFFSRESIDSVGVRFLNALARGDVDQLTEMSYLGNDTEEEMRKKWDVAVNRAGKYYLFAYHITAARQIDENTAQITMQFVKDAADPNSFDEKHEIPLVKVGNKWKVDVKSINRDIYPALPR